MEINVYASICRVTSCQRCKFSFFIVSTIGNFWSQAKIKRQFRQLPFFQLSYDMRTKQFSIFLLVIGASINWHKRSQRYNKKSNWLELRAASICICIWTGHPQVLICLVFVFVFVFIFIFVFWPFAPIGLSYEMQASPVSIPNCFKSAICRWSRLLGAFSIGREFIYVFAAKISARREFVCKRLMDLWGELNRYLRNRQRLMDPCQPLGRCRDLIWLQILLLLKNQSYQQFLLRLHFNWPSQCSGSLAPERHN